MRDGFPNIAVAVDWLLCEARTNNVSCSGCWRRGHDAAICVSLPPSRLDALHHAEILSAGEILPWEALQSAQLCTIRCSLRLLAFKSFSWQDVLSSAPGETKNGCLLWVGARIHWPVGGSMPQSQVFFAVNEGYSSGWARLSEALEVDVSVTDWTTSNMWHLSQWIKVHYGEGAGSPSLCHG